MWIEYVYLQDCENPCISMLDREIYKPKLVEIMNYNQIFLLLFRHFHSSFRSATWLIPQRGLQDHYANFCTRLWVPKKFYDMIHPANHQDLHQVWHPTHHQLLRQIHLLEHHQTHRHCHHLGYHGNTCIPMIMLAMRLHRQILLKGTGAYQQSSHLNFYAKHFTPIIITMTTSVLKTFLWVHLRDKLLTWWQKLGLNKKLCK